MDSPTLERRLFHKGAEADLYLARIGPWKIVLKERVEKKYRHKDLDRSIRRERTSTEATALGEARRAGVHTPSIVSLDLDTFSIGMSYLPGKLLRDALDSMSVKAITSTFHEIGSQLGRLHSTEMVHGDLTTSNIILAEGLTPFLIDFGLSRRSSETEDRAIDLHLLQRSIVTSHRTNAKRCLSSLAAGYSKEVGGKTSDRVKKKAAEVARRGRYFAIR